MVRHPWLIFVAIPCAINLLLVGMYFSGIPFIQHLVVPNLPNMVQAREFGILENLQNIYLLGMTFMGVMAIRIKEAPLEKIGAVLFTIFAAFIFLEEIDYGLHWKEYLAGTPLEEQQQVRNWHNEGQRRSGRVDHERRVAQGCARRAGRDALYWSDLGGEAPERS